SHLFNERTGLIRGVNFRNSGRIEGYGRFYFTGETNMQSAGFFIGSDELEPIQFFDTTPNGVLFDMPGGTVSHVVRPLSMDPEPLEDFDCTAPPTVAGDPPLTTPIS